MEAYEKVSYVYIENIKDYLFITLEIRCDEQINFYYSEAVLLKNMVDNNV